MMKKNNNYRFILLALLCVTILMAKPFNLLAQGQVFLSKGDINGFELARQLKYTRGYDKQIKTIDVQEWRLLNSKENDHIDIQYYVFNSIPSAINGTNRLSQRFAVPYIWGSPTGTIIGEDTWSSLKTNSTNSSALFFVKGNVGIQLCIHGMIEDQLIKEIIDKLESKIDKYIQINITSVNINLLSDSFINMQPMMEKSYINNVSKLSQWVIDSIQYKSGLRKEWNDGTITMGIDICLFKNTQEAMAAAKVKSKNCSISKHIYDLKDPNYNQLVKSEWDFYLNSKISNQTFSFIGYNGYTAFHVYGFNVENNDIGLIQTIIKNLVEIEE